MDRDKRNDELERELRAHLEMEAEEWRERGLSPEDAQSAARRAFGSRALAMERTREVWGKQPLESLLRGMRLALRRARLTPTFTLTVALVIALAVGVTTAIFSVIDVAFLKQLPYPEPERLAYISMISESPRYGANDQVLNGSQWEILRDHLTVAEAAVYSEWTSGVNCGAGDRAFFVRQQRVGSSFFSVLGVPPLFGRGFSPEEDAESGPQAVVLSDSLRRRVFGEEIPIGRKLLLRGEAYTVVGVMPPAFWSGVPVDLWTPLRASKTGEGEGANYQAMIRLRPGVGEAAAVTELRNLSGLLPPRKTVGNDPAWTTRFQMQPLAMGRSTGLRKPLFLLLNAVVVVLLIGAINVGGLLLARQSGRAAELATRMALGATRAQVFREVLLDSVVLIALGGLLSGPAAYGALRGLQWANGRLFSQVEQAAIDGRALLAAMGCTIAAGLLAGLLPAWQSVQLQNGGRTVAGRKRVVPLGVLVAGQVALVAPLLIGAGLLGRTFVSLWTLQAGFDPNDLLIARISLQDARYETAAKVQQLFRGGLEKMRAIPGVESVAAGLTVPYERQLNQGVRIGAQPVAEERYRSTNLVYVTPSFLDTLRVPLLRGRGLADADTETSGKVAVVNDAFIRRFLDGRDGVGEFIRLGGKDPVQIVGIAGSTAQRNSERGAPLEPDPTVYIPVSQMTNFALVHQWFSPAWVVRSTLPPEVLSSQLEETVRSLDPMIPVSQFTTPYQLKSSALGVQRLMLCLLFVISGLGLLLCALGVYGLVASSVAERTREIGIRMALGASVEEVVRKAMRPGLLWAMAGLMAGVPLVYMGRTLMTGLIYGVSAVDPVTYVGIGAVLLVAVAAASLLPALKLTRLDPAVTLRNE